MDKELLRLAIIIAGAVIFVMILLWGIVGNRRSRRKYKGYGKRDPLDNIDESLILNTKNDEFDIIPLGSALEDEMDLKNDPDEAYDDVTQGFEEESLESQGDSRRSNVKVGPEGESKLPDLIQFSIRAPDDSMFKGDVLIPALQSAGLIYGDLKIFERLDDNNLVDYGVANMVKPGIFPDQNLESFTCPGIVFFMQPREVDNPLAVFDDLVSTINRLTKQLGGMAQDERMQPLSQQTIDLFRKQMAG